MRKKLIIEDDNKILDGKRYFLRDFRTYNFVENKVDDRFLASALSVLKDEGYISLEKGQISEDILINFEDYHHHPSDEDYFVRDDIVRRFFKPSKLQDLEPSLGEECIKKIQNKEYLNCSEIMFDIFFKHIKIGLVRKNADPSVLPTKFFKLEDQLSFEIIKKNFQKLKEDFSNYITAFKEDEQLTGRLDKWLRIGSYMGYSDSEKYIVEALQRRRGQRTKNICFEDSDIDEVLKDHNLDKKCRFHETVFALESKGLIKVKQIREEGHVMLLDTTDKFDDYIRLKQQESEEKAKKSKEVLAGNTFHEGGDFWTIIYENKIIRLKYMKGLQYIAYLLRYPSEPFHVFRLIQGVEGTSVKSKKIYDKMTQEQLEKEGLNISDLGSAGEIIDQKARDEYKQRLFDIDKDLGKAESHNNTGQVAKLVEEKQAIQDQLLEAHGLGGRPRKTADVNERARKLVSISIHRALDKIESKKHSILRLHLKNALKIGLFLSYNPDHKIHWNF